MLASVIGLRAKATAMPVPSSSRSVCSAAKASGRNGSWLGSAPHTPSYPASSASLALAAAWFRSPLIPPSTFMAAQVSASSAAASFAPEELLQLGRDLVTGTQRGLVERGGLLGVDLALQLAPHGQVPVVVGDELLDPGQ